MGKQRTLWKITMSILKCVIAKEDSKEVKSKKELKEQEFLYVV
jgi:hypothetical protein